MSTITYENRVKRLEVGKTIFDFADELTMEVPSSCGRKGECHECVVEIISGMESLNTAREPESFLRGNYRLACQALVESTDIDVHFVPLRRKPKILSSGHSAVPLDFDPAVS
ncbi:uncharacterized protein METZ01_LOCUS407308, partial [marine metagenome]